MTPFKEAVQKLASKRTIVGDLSSSEWADVLLALRDRAFFSARTTNAQYAQSIRDRVAKILEPRTVMRDGRPVTEGMNVATARAELKEILQSIGYDPGDKGGSIQDLSSDQRLNLVLQHNVQAAQGYGNWLQGQASGVIDAFPAQELFRAEERKEPRNWPTRWMQAGGKIIGGRMIALKSDPIWESISAFGTPWPPFDYNSGMWVRDIDRAEAEQLGLLKPGESVQPVVEDFNNRLEASAQKLDPDLLQSLKQSLGDQVEVSGNTIRWSATGKSPPPAPAPAPTPPANPVPAPTPTPKPQPVLPDISDLIQRHDSSTLHVRKVAIVEEARERLSIPVAARREVPLTLKTRVAEVKRDALAGASIVSRYTAPELVQKTSITVEAGSSHRAHYSPRTRTAVLHRYSGAATAAHEIMHGVEEQNPALLKAAAEFLIRRGTGETPQKLSTLTGNRGYRGNEIALKDKWKEGNGSVYAGKVYTHSGSSGPLQPADIRFTEILTMGIERLHADPIEFAKNDRDWFDFVIKTLRNV